MGESSKKDARHYVVDTSALYPLILKYPELFVANAANFIILDLTKYEIGNAIRFDGEIKDPYSNFEMFNVVTASLRTHAITNLSDTGRLSVLNNITFYDAAYIQAAIDLNTKVITMDKELLNKFRDKTMTIDDFKAKENRI